MRIVKLAFLLGFLIGGAALHAETKNPSDYTLRVHIFSRHSVTRYYNGVRGASSGDGRADLFEGGSVHGLDFDFDCWDRLPSTVLYETFPARWKKPGQELSVLIPVAGKLGSFYSCTLKTTVKNFAYVYGPGGLQTETPEEYVAWMRLHHYDPEHGKDSPDHDMQTRPSMIAVPPGGLIIKPAS